jgi:hypothetical protein
MYVFVSKLLLLTDIVEAANLLEMMSFSKNADSAQNMFVDIRPTPDSQYVK